ncbi:MAG: hypothetical protein ACOYL5_16670 [Phototrophicaceae bacterium]|jgi:5-methylcytosine-specific restriction protein A
MFEVGQLYNRTELHQYHGGQRHSRISTPAKQAAIFAFATPDDPNSEYRCGWTSYGVFRFIGEGRVGHMSFARGNLALRQHTQAGKVIHLFTRPNHATPDWVRYEGRFAYSSHFYKEGGDIHNNMRRMIVFLLKPLQA